MTQAVTLSEVEGSKPRHYANFYNEALGLRENYLKNLKTKEAFILAKPGDAATSKILSDGVGLNVKLKELFRERGCASKGRKEGEEDG